MECGFLSERDRMPIGVEQIALREESGARIGITRLMMMENAGSAIASFVADKFERANILLVAGTGNNGGDAFVAARHLTYWNKFEIVVALIGSETQIHAEEALTNWRILKNIGKVKKIQIDTDDKLALLDESLSQSTIIISAIFGTGFRGRPRNLHELIIGRINTSGSTRISVDIPSGMDAETGNYEIAVKSDYTITMDSPKKGLLANDRARKTCGIILVANIGVPA